MCSKKLRDENFSLQKRVNKGFEIMFETGVDEMAWDDTVSHLVADSIKGVIKLQCHILCRRTIVWVVLTSGRQ